MTLLTATTTTCLTCCPPPEPGPLGWFVVAVVILGVCAFLRDSPL